MSLADKLARWEKSPEGQAKIQAKVKEYRQSGVTTTGAGSSVNQEDRISGAVSRLRNIVYNTALSHVGLESAPAPDSIPSSVVDKHIANMDSTEKIYMLNPDTGEGEVWVWFGGDLSRNSLDPDTYSEGIDNIIALLNNGYDAQNYVYGYWDDHEPAWTDERSGTFDLRSIDSAAWIRSRKNRPPLHFIQQAIDDFNGNYSSEYNVTAVAADIYYE